MTGTHSRTTQTTGEYTGKTLDLLPNYQDILDDHQYIWQTIMIQYQYQYSTSITGCKNKLHRATTCLDTLVIIHPCIFYYHTDLKVCSGRMSQTPRVRPEQTLRLKSLSYRRRMVRQQQRSSKQVLLSRSSV